MKLFQKSKFSKLLNLLLTALLIVSTGILVFVTYCTVKGKPVMFGGKCILMIITGSMNPAIQVGDCVIIEQITPDSLQERDIIAYVSENQDIFGMTVLHRITQILPDGTFRTQGDANPIPDEMPVRPDQIRGKFVRKTRFFTWLTSFADLRKALLLLVMCVTSAMALYEVRTVMQIGKEIQSESEQDRRERILREAIEKEKQRLREQNTPPKDGDAP